MFRVDPKTVTRWAKVPLVEATGSRRRLQALGYMGHSVESLSSHLDEPEDLMRRVQDGRVDQIPVGVAALISAAYDALWNVDGGDEHAAWLARGRRYAPPLAWDDNPGDPHWIDDPGCPASMWQRRGSPGPRICGRCETQVPPQRSLCESCTPAASARACERCGQACPAVVGTAAWTAARPPTRRRKPPSAAPCWPRLSAGRCCAVRSAVSTRRTRACTGVRAS